MQGMLGRALIHDLIGKRWLRFDSPREILSAYALADVLPVLRRVEAWADECGGHAVGFISYEAAPAFDAALSVRPAPDFPLLWFGLYDEPEILTSPSDVGLGDHIGSPLRAPREWLPSVTRAEYDAAIAQVREHIARGDTYQVNYTMRLRAAYTEDPYRLFLQLVRSQPNSYAAFIDTGRYVICSASPELFLRRDGAHWTMRPMKGTAPRGRYTLEDRARAEWLYHSEKNRAENVMIVDMVRNDLGRLAEVGSVRPTRLWEVERYPTVWQMTSTIEATSAASFTEMLGATFPCASITGAPKVSTMRIIARLETEPRRVYTGCIGFVAPGQRARFNVAIRTAVVDRELGQAEYGVGGGIVWDSEAGDEYDECRHKARVLTESPPEFQLLESLRWTPDQHYWLLDYHLRRLRDSADYFDFAYDEPRVRAELVHLAHTLPHAPHKVRLLLARGGELTMSAAPFKRQREPLCLMLAPTPVNSNNRFLFHKTTQRAVYDEAIRACPGADDVLLWNERGEITETCAANIVVQFGDQYITPPLECGLLAGTLRAALLDEGKLTERVVRIADLERADGIFRINSVRGWQRCKLYSRVDSKKR